MTSSEAVMLHIRVMRTRLARLVIDSVRVFSATLQMKMFPCMTFLAAAVALVSGEANPVNIFRTDITPEEAQQYLGSPPFTEPQLAGRTAVLPLVRWNDPRFRTAEAGPTLGHYWKNGKEIENTEDYLEEVYDASQFHGQDGLGAYTYGYKTPESSKVEDRVRSGDVTGSYVYKAGSSNDLIKVRYWADSQGFHQEDNLPKYQPEPVQETAAVRAARIAHEKAWKEAADANLHPYQFQQQQQQQLQQLQQQQYQQYQGQSYPGQNQYSQSRDSKTYNQNQLGQPQYNGQQFKSEQQYSGQYQGNLQASASNQQYQYAQPTVTDKQNGLQQAASNQQYQLAQPSQRTDSQQAASDQQYQSVQSQYQNAQQQYQSDQQQNEDDGQYKYEDPEPTGPPRGFFYSYNYPVSIIVPKSELQGGAVNPGQTVDHDTVAVSGQQ